VTTRNWAKETWIAAFSVPAIVTFLIARWGFGWPHADWFLFAVLAAGIPLIVDLIRSMIAGRFGSDMLAGISIVTSVVLGEYLAGSVIVLMLSGGAALEQYATRRASAVLGALAKRMPRVAHRQGAGKVEDIELDAVRLGDALVVFPHEVCPVDGEVVDGQGAMDESYLTGEPYGISKTRGSGVMSGAVNGAAALTIRVGRLPVDSRYAKIVEVMQQAEMDRPQLRRIADRLGVWYTVAALVVAGIGWFVSGHPTRFLAVLVIATPCPLLLAIPVAIIGAISLAASRSIIVKNPAMLEQVASCRTMIFDKTGTLTYGKPLLTEILCGPGFEEATVLRVAASLEQYSKHPLASAILDAAKKRGIGMEPIGEIEEKPGAGLTGRIGADEARITGRGKLQEELKGLALPPIEPGMESILLMNGEYAAAFRFRDEPREDSKSFLQHLNPKHGVKRIMLLSGDREAEVRYLAARVGITEALFGKTPEEKLEIVRAEAKRAPTLFIGDGINDAPAMQAATVGIAFGQNSDVTAEAADAVIMEPSLRKLDELIHIGRRMRRIALQSAIGGIALSMVGMGMAATGHLSPVAGAVAQEVIDVLAVLNAVRASLPGNDLPGDDLEERV
jgi:heavy metal translocating P-type ATPase